MQLSNIDKKSEDQQLPYKHLLPIVVALIERGNTTTTESKFHNTQDGWRCDLRDPIDFGFLKGVFSFPDSIELVEEDNSIFCRESWIVIKGGWGERISQGHHIDSSIAE